ncbi:MAG: glycosyltransferase [Pseudomonadota bacterium]
MADVTILMSVLNGAAHLPAQLRSIAAQSHQQWRLICSDDGSTDASLSLLSCFKDTQKQQVQLQRGPENGFAANYLSLLATLPRDVEYVALADQDDIWHADKLARALILLPRSMKHPALYCARQWYWRERDGSAIASPRRGRPFSFRNALVENVATGNTIMLNPQAARLARRYTTEAKGIFAHDWWLYQLVTGIGGKIIFDNGPPPLLYRQHDRNAIGINFGLLSQLSRKMQVIKGVYAARITAHLRALNTISPIFTKEARESLIEFNDARRAGISQRLYQLSKSGAYRQSWQGTLGLWGAASLGRI